MTASRPRVRRKRRGRGLLVGAAIAVAFLAGFGVGSALQDGRSGEGSQTIVRTLNPLPLAPAARETVTVTVRSP